MAEERDREDYRSKLALIGGGALLLIFVGMFCAHSCPPGYTWDPMQNCCADGAGVCLATTCANPVPAPNPPGCCDPNVWQPAPDSCCGPAPGICTSNCGCRQKPDNTCCSVDTCWNGAICECIDAAKRIPSGGCCPGELNWIGVRCQCPDPLRLIPITGACCPLGTTWDSTELCCATAPGNCITCFPADREIPMAFGGGCCPSVDATAYMRWTDPPGKCICSEPARRVLSGPSTDFCCWTGTHWDNDPAMLCCADDLTNLCVYPACGDVNADGSVTGADVARLVSYLGGGPAIWEPAGDVDLSGVVDADDVIYLTNFFSGGPAPCNPPHCPVDTAWDDVNLRCECTIAARFIPDTGACCPDGTTWDDLVVPPCCKDAFGNCVAGFGPWGWYCLGGDIVTDPPVCGDGICSVGECNPGCPDCDPCCGNGNSEAGETCSSCPGDVGSCPPCNANTICEPTENCFDCPGDCPSDTIPAPPNYFNTFTDMHDVATWPDPSTFTFSFTIPSGSMSSATMDMRLDDCGTVTVNGALITGQTWDCSIDDSAHWVTVDLMPYINAGSNTFVIFADDYHLGYIGYDMSISVIYSDITMCCGNGICEGTETATCPVDCTGGPVPPSPSCTLAASPSSGTRPLTSTITATYTNVPDGTPVSLRCHSTTPYQTVNLAGGSASISCTYATTGIKRPRSTYSTAVCNEIVSVVSSSCQGVSAPCPSDNCCPGLDCLRKSPTANIRCCIPEGGTGCTPATQARCCTDTCVGTTCVRKPSGAICSYSWQCCGSCAGGHCT
ncbi:MAG: dockerin type I repeat-containing protein [Candidatus Micrarchaeota archaeon]